MKQMIVLVSMVSLGILLAGLVMGFGESASEIAQAVKGELVYENIKALPDSP